MQPYCYFKLFIPYRGLISDCICGKLASEPLIRTRWRSCLRESMRHLAFWSRSICFASVTADGNRTNDRVLMGLEWGIEASGCEISLKQNKPFIVI